MSAALTSVTLLELQKQTSTVFTLGNNGGKKTE